jgi:hypothetical protein
VTQAVLDMLTPWERGLLTFDHRGALLRLSHGVRTRRLQGCPLARSFLVIPASRP